MVFLRLMGPSLLQAHAAVQLENRIGAIECVGRQAHIRIALEGSA